ncbi:MAG: DUF4198 domain-containing protein [Myxococcota bacterium]
MALVVFLGAARVAAHDYWMTPDPRASPPGPVTVHLWVGENLEPEEERPFAADRTVSFVHITKKEAARALDPVDGVPLWRGALAAGGHLFALHRNIAYVELEAKRFEGYLRHKGLTSIIEERAARGESDAPGTERYQRYLKLWFAVGEAPDDVYGRVVGHELELLLLDRPKAGAPIRIRTLFRGQPLPGFSMTAQREGGEPQRLQTDAQGELTLPALEAGMWLARGVHMLRVDGDKRADWESFWAAFTFTVAEPTSAPTMPTPLPPSKGCGGCHIERDRSSDGEWVRLALLGLLGAARRRFGRRASSLRTA